MKTFLGGIRQLSGILLLWPADSRRSGALRHNSHIKQKVRKPRDGLPRPAKEKGAVSQPPALRSAQLQVPPVINDTHILLNA